MKLEDLMIIDWDKLGNVVRFYLGPKDLDDFYGDDWDDKPYEHNAERVYSEFVSGYIDIAWDLNCIVKEPCEGHCNSPYCKDDFKFRNIPIIAVHKLSDKNDYGWLYDTFEECFVRSTEKIFMKYSAEMLINKGNILKISID